MRSHPRFRYRLWPACALLVFTSLARAGETHVVPDEFPTIQAAITAAADGDTVLVQPGTYPERILCTKSIDIRSAGGAHVTIIDASGLGPGPVVRLEIPSGGSLSGFTITGGSAADGAGISTCCGEPVIADCLIIGNHAGSGGDGGGALIVGSDPRFERCVFRDNSAAAGGAVFHYALEPAFVDCTFENNHAARTGGVFLDSSKAHFERCVFRGNTTVIGASAMAVRSPSLSPSLSDNLFCAQGEPPISGQWNDLGGNLVLQDCPCPADYNGDGFVDGLDYDLFNNDFESPDPQQQMNADYNSDGFVDGMDYDLFNNAFEAGC